MNLIHACALIALLNTQLAEEGSVERAPEVGAGIALYHQGEFEASVRAIERSLDGLKAPIRRAHAYLYLGLAHAVLGAWDQARAAFERAIEARPEIAPDRRRTPPHIVNAFEEVRAGLKGDLQVRTKRPSTVFVDGVPRGVTPFAGQVAAGLHQIRVRSLDDRYEAVLEEVVIGVGTRTRIDPQLVLRDGELSLHSHPTGAQVTINGQIVGRTPLEGHTLPAGKIELRMVAKGYKEKLLRAEVSPTQPLELDVQLELSDMLESKAPPSFGLDLREGVDRWTVDVGLAIGGLAPVSTNLQPEGPTPNVLRGGFQMGLEMGLSLANFAQCVGELGVGSFGSTEAYFGSIAPTAGETRYLGRSSDSTPGPYRSFRLGMLCRVALFRAGDWRPFVGTGYAYLPSVGRVQHEGLPTAQGKDGYQLEATMRGDSLLLLGTKYVVFERVRRSGYFALEVALEGRMEFTRWTLSTDTEAETVEGLVRAAEAAQSWEAALLGRNSISVGFVAQFALRF